MNTDSDLAGPPVLLITHCRVSCNPVLYRGLTLLSCPVVLTCYPTLQLQPCLPCPVAVLCNPALLPYPTSLSCFVLSCFPAPPAGPVALPCSSAPPAYPVVLPCTLVHQPGPGAGRGAAAAGGSVPSRPSPAVSVYGRLGPSAGCNERRNDGPGRVRIVAARLLSVVMYGCRPASECELDLTSAGDHARRNQTPD